VYAWLPPAVIVAEAGLIVMWSSAPALTVRLAVAIFPLSLPVTVWLPATVAVQEAPVQEPSGAIENVVEAVTLPRLLLKLSKPCAVYAWLPPAVIVAEAGLIVMWSRAPALTVRLAVAVFPLSSPVTVCDPATEAVQDEPVQEPSGVIENVVAPVTSPRLLLNWSKPVAV
jgi:hypothetical protein